MAIYGNTFDAFTIVSAGLSLLFTVAATGGDYWMAYGTFGEEKVEAGLWEVCTSTDELQHCSPYPQVGGNKNI